MDAPADAPQPSPPDPQAAQDRPPAANPLRIRPAVILILLLWVGVLVPPMFLSFGQPLVVALIVGVIGVQLVWLLWWLLASGVPWRDRLVGLLLWIVTLGVCLEWLYHPSAKTGLSGPTILMPWTLTAVTLVMLLTRSWAWRVARWPVAATLVLALLSWNVVRVKGADGGLTIHVAWRWSPTSEELFLAQQDDDPATPAADAPSISVQPGDWPGFRGAGRDSRLRGEYFSTNWQAQPPVERWRVRVGPGWSSMAIVDGHLFTQEQRGENECVVAYDASTGQEQWSHQVEARFTAVESGPGPLATPTFHEGSLYTSGATGVVQRLDAATGQAVWRRQLTDDLPRQKPHDWGFASSPLVLSTDQGELVLVYGGNPRNQPAEGQAVIAYHADSGEPAWTAGRGGHSYTSPTVATLSGKRQVLMASNEGLESLDPATGKTLWFYEWSSGEFPRIALPIVMDPQTLVLAAGYGIGAHGLRVTQEGDAWQTETLWQSRQLKPYFNDNVGYDGHVYGFDNKFLTCLDAASGDLAWPKRTRRQTQFGCGQVLLVEDNRTLVVMTELTGEIVLLEAKPGKPNELARLQVFADGEKTWNHPVIAHGRLYVRNAAEMACYELPPVDVAAR